MVKTVFIRSGRNAGFSLLELLIVVAIIGILARIALPQYKDYVARSKIPEATGSLAQMRTAIEQWYADNRTYAGFVCSSPVQPGNESARNFTLTCDVAANTYTLTATGKADKGMDGYVYTVNQANAQTSSTPRSAGACWIMSNGGSC